MTHPTRDRSRRSLGPAALVALLAAIGAGCAISSDPEPRRIDAADVPYDLLSPTTAAPPTLAAGVPVEASVIYLANEREEMRRVTPVIRQVPRPVTLDQRLLQLVEARPTPDERDQGLSNVITSHTRIRQVRQDDLDGKRRVIIELDRFFPGLGSDDVSLAVAQVVYTVDEHYPEENPEVEFRVDGQPESIRTGAGTALDVVSTKDFTEYSPESNNPPTTTSTSRA